MPSWSVTLCMWIFLLTVGYWLYWRWTHRRLIQLANLIPGPPTLPIIGSAYIFMANPKEQLNIMSKCIEKYGEYTKFWLGPELNICVENPSDIRLLLTSNKVTQKGPMYEFMKPIVGSGILSGGPNWRSHRKIITPSYSKGAIQHYVIVFNEESKHLVKILLNKDPKTTFNVYTDLVQYTTQCVCQTVFGLSKENSRSVKNLDSIVAETPRIYSLIFKKMTRWWLRIPLMYWLLGGKKIEMDFIDRLNVMNTDIINKKFKELDKNSFPDLNALDRYIKYGKMTEQELKEAIFVLFTSSQEASAKIASALLLFLAHLPNWQEKVYNEIVDKLGFDNDSINEEQIKSLKYLDMVYNEAVRYLSIGAMIQRTVTEEITINNGKLTLPAGTSLVIPIHHLHRDPRYWDEPNKVKPERFLPENIKQRDPNAFIPFSLGPMDCIGRVFATSVIKIMAVHVLRQLELVAVGPPLEELELHVAISVRFADGYNLRVRPREHRRQPI